MKHGAWMPWLLSFAILFPVRAAAGPVGWLAGVNLGSAEGPGFQIHTSVRDFTRGMPLSARVAIGYNKADAGDPLAARRVFINNNTNGTPTDEAHCYQFRFDFLYRLTEGPGKRINVFLGPRYARYTAEYVYVGGNEDFEVRTSPWGLGGGLEASLDVGPAAELLLQLGLDHFRRADLTGHDTTYTPDGVDINPREDYDYGSADEAVDQPRTEVLAMVGLQFAL